jgi:two-component system nitrogen regulation sensor histidine kinase NtrY
MAAQNPSPTSQPIAGDLVPLQPGITREQRRLKRKLISRVIVFCLCLIPLFIWLQSRLFERDIQFPLNSNIVIFALINLNVILVLVVLFLILRYLAELIFERKRNILGSKLRTKLVVSFLSLSLLPTILLFFVALQFVSSSVDYWFNSSIEESLQESLDLARAQIQDSRNQAKGSAARIVAQVATAGPHEITQKSIADLLDQMLILTPAALPSMLTVLIDKPALEVSRTTGELQSVVAPNVPVEILQQVRIKNANESLIQPLERGELVRNIRQIRFGTEPETSGILITSLLISQDRLDRMTRISSGIEDYRQLKYLKDPFKFWLLLILLMVTLLIVFAAIWFGLRIARTITEPVDELVAATRRISEGDFDFTMAEVSGDEIGQLVSSFNTMTSNINTSNKQLADTHRALQQSSQESEQRRRYTEIILQNVSAGVVSLDENGRITTINNFAAKLLRIDGARYINMTYREVLPREYTHILDRFIEELYATGKLSIEQHLKVTINRVALSLMVNFTRLEDDEGTPIGFVLVFDNLTKIEKMQRMAAWREVARRIAHEIKNPLTPIQLSAQRLRKRYPEILAEEDSVFDRCTDTIINQVEALKQLVSEFSQFARMPRINKTPGDLAGLTRETLVLYQEAHKHIDFGCRIDQEIPIFDFDGEQIKRSLINLLDNAVAVLPNGGKIDVELSINPFAQTVLVKVFDDGPGISKANKLKLFEPYFSTKKSGTGLGLAIVSTIVNDHGGYIRVQDNQPSGSVFTIELPLENNEMAIDPGRSGYS